MGLHALHLHTTQFLDVLRVVGLFTCVGAFVQPFAHVASDGLYVTTMHAQFLDVKLVAEQVLSLDFLPRSGHGLEVFAVLLDVWPAACNHRLFIDEYFHFTRLQQRW